MVNPNGGSGTLVLTGANTFYDDALEASPTDSGGDHDRRRHAEHRLGRARRARVSVSRTPVPLGYLPPAPLGFPVSGASSIPADIVINGGTLQATAHFNSIPSAASPWVRRPAAAAERST